jgi:uncharacterized protein (TIGR02145 family)
MRRTSNNPSRNDALTDVLGNIPLAGSFETLGYPNDRIIGAKKLRDRTLIITTDDDSANPTASYGRLWSVPLHDDTVIMSNFTLLYNGLLNLSMQHPIEDIVEFYESDSIHKVYWTDDYNNLRFCNLVDPLLSTRTPDEFDIVQKVTMVIPEFSKVVNGNIPVGMVQYSYRLYKLYGAASNFSPASQMFPLSQSSQSLANTTTFKGSDALDSSGEGLSSGKGIQIKITGVDTNYDRIEVVAIHYSTLNGEPTVSIVDVKPVSSTIYVTDDGDYDLGTYTLAEYLLINNPLRCKTIATKNNILFAANTRQSEFDFSYDSRAYRWRYHTWEDCRLDESNGEYWYNHRDNPNLWIHYNSSGISIGTVIGMANLPLDIDAICRNNIQYDKKQLFSSSYLYQTDCVTIGGEGPNVKYTITPTAVGDVNRAIDYDSPDNTFFISRQTYPDPGYYGGSESPLYNQQLRGFCRDEIYRFGIIGYDDKGRISPVKWIGDIRMPNNEFEFESPYGNSPFCQTVNLGYVRSRPLQINFTLSNLPSDVKYVQIVYVKRTDEDKTVKLQGKANLLTTKYAETAFINPAKSTVGDYNSSSKEGPEYAARHIAIFSPDISYYKKFVQTSGDYVEIIGTYKGVIDASSNFETLKCYDLTTINPRDVSVISARLEETTNTPDNITTEKNFGTLTAYGRYNFLANMVKYSGVNTYVGNLGTCLLVQMSAFFDTNNLPSTEYFLLNYRTNLWGTQYGGHTYEDRTRNEYISAGKMVSVSSGSATAYANYGDTYIGYADHLVSYYNKYYEENQHWFGAVEMFPVETSVNLAYTLDDCWHRIYNQLDTAYYLREKNNSEFTAAGNTYSPGWTDLYLENTAYIKLADARKFYPAPLDYDPDEVNDTLVMASNAKVGKETIDPWTQWASNENIQVDNSFGPINKLFSWKNFLLYWQTDAIGALSVLDRSVVTDQQGRSTKLGEGDILSRFDIISTNLGLSTRFSITESFSGIYWYDHKRKTINRFLNSIEDVSTIRGVNSYLQSIDNDFADYDNVISPSKNGKGFFMFHNPMYKEPWFIIKENSEYGIALLLYEVEDSFICFVDTQAYFYLKVDNKVFSAYNKFVYREDKGYPGHFFGKYYDSYVTVVVNPKPNLTSLFTNLEITSEVYKTDLETTQYSVTIPVLTTRVIDNITGTSARSGGTITFDGGDSIIDKGVCYGLSTNPTIENSSKLSAGSEITTFISNISGLQAGQTYYVRAYATNSAGTAYGNERTFTIVSLATLITTIVSSITDVSAISGIEVSNFGGETPSAFGICCNTGATPTIANKLYPVTLLYSRTSGLLKSYTKVLDGLIEDTNYHIRAYCTNSTGTAYGNEIAFSTNNVVAADVLTTEISSITTTTAVSGGNIVSGGGGIVTARGICWNTSSNPTISNSHTVNGSGLGTFSANLINLVPGTIYYVRAYATTSGGTTYGNEVVFTTNELSVLIDLSDLDNNVYYTVIINNQEWIVSNLKTTKYADGVSIPYIEMGTEFSADRSGAYCWPNNDIDNRELYGAIYNWYAVNNARGLVYFKRNGVHETGWRVATKTDWENLATYLGGNSVTGGKLKENGTEHWASPNIGATNETGFTAIPAGVRDYVGNFNFLSKTIAAFWTATQYDTSQAVMRVMYNTIASLGVNNYDKRNGMSVKCVRDI